MNRYFIIVSLFLALVAAPAADAQVINEWVADHTGTDQWEYVEIFGDPSTDYSHLTILQIEGDPETSTGTIGRIDSAMAVGTTDASGFWYTGFFGDVIENGSKTFLLVDTFTGAVGDDIDGNNDGTMDTTFWDAIVDDVAAWDRRVTSPNTDDVNDAWYSSVVLSYQMDPSLYEPGGASRIPNGTDTDAVSDWKRNDYSGCGLPGLTGFLETYEACNTPNEVNSAFDVDPPVLNEIVFDHVGADTHEFIEVYGPAGGVYTTFHVLVVDGDTGDDMGTIDLVYQVGSTNGGSSWSTPYIAGLIEDGTTTFLLVNGFTGSVGDDLDDDDDGALDASPPWSAVADDVAFADGDAGDGTYSTVVLNGYGGASRFPSGYDSDAASDWHRNDFDGQGLDGFTGSVTAGEAYNTKALANRIALHDLYKDVDASSAANLRATLHEVIDDHIRHEYTDGLTDTWDILEPASEDPANPSNILDVYKNASYTKQGGGNIYYQREHTWPSSYGLADTSVPYTDCHHLFLCAGSYNSDRSNYPFEDCGASCAEYVTDVHPITGGGGSGVYPGNSNWMGGSRWETWMGRRGDVARAVLYMDIRYEGGEHAVSGLFEPDLVLTDNPALIVTTNSSPAYMGILTDILAWHAQDPPGSLEFIRVNEVWEHQGNRNPFIDNPEWAECLHSGVCNSVTSDGFESGDMSAWSAVVSP